MRPSWLEFILQFLLLLFMLYFFSFFFHHDEMMTISCVLSDGVGILDTKFGTVQAWQPFPEKLTADRKVSCLSVFLYIYIISLFY